MRSVGGAGRSTTESGSEDNLIKTGLSAGGSGRLSSMPTASSTVEIAKGGETGSESPGGVELMGLVTAVPAAAGGFTDASRESSMEVA
jgi:hypothetical protein